MDTRPTCPQIIVFPSPVARNVLQAEVLRRVELLVLDDEPAPEPAPERLDWRLEDAATK
jgi:hypothetical protein